MGGVNCHEKRPTSEREEILCIALALKHSSRNPNMALASKHISFSSINRSKQSSNLVFHETVHTCYACGCHMQQSSRFQDVSERDFFDIQAPVGGGDMQLRPCFRIRSERDFSFKSSLSDSPYAVYFEPDNAHIFNEFSRLIRDYPNLVVLLPSGRRDHPDPILLAPNGYGQIIEEIVRTFLCIGGLLLGEHLACLLW